VIGSLATSKKRDKIQSGLPDGPILSLRPSVPACREFARAKFEKGVAFLKTKRDLLRFSIAFALRSFRTGRNRLALGEGARY
jgi:hypothetical protein